MDEFNDGIRRLGSLPKDAFDADRTQSSKQLMATIAKCQQELQGLTHVNKKALDQFQSFNEQRDKLIDRRDEAGTPRSGLSAHISPYLPTSRALEEEACYCGPTSAREGTYSPPSTAFDCLHCVRIPSYSRAALRTLHKTVLPP